MTTQFAVTASSAADKAGDIAQVIASLPVSLHQAFAAADLVGIAGGDGWVDAAKHAIESGARGVLIVDPVAFDVVALIKQADAAGVPVVIDATWTHNPAVAASADAFVEHCDADGFIEARVNVPLGSDIERVLLNQLSLVRTVVSPISRLRFARKNSRGYDALADLVGGASASLSAILSSSGPVSATLRILQSETSVEVELPSPVSAAPGSVIVSGPEGATLLPTQWETAHRAAWRRLHGLVDAGELSRDLAGFARDVAAIRTAK
ncbi:hypothetical protein [Cryobacterium sp. TMS1-13-1]|uniref:hypothetical protein n=1 Tax=Cryobacterium sp. TMS1-13-1 TaxID=1259220 RepID=UPI00106CB843|nr:hypothetical protein [Cryobacterium sp. TMS1-13-1]TFD20092.1 hypothetical protein E3T31_14230 [Cryobacterium sp. TMS1-13-1]